MPFGKRRREMKSIDEFNHEIERLSELKDDACKRAEYDEAAAIREEIDAVKLEQLECVNATAMTAVNAIFGNIEKKRVKEKRASTLCPTLSSQSIPQEDRFILPYGHGAPVHYEGRLPGIHPICGPPADTMDDTRMRNLERIVEMTDCNAPGIYEPRIIEEVNSLARNALGVPTVSPENWSHNKPKKDTDPAPFTRNPKRKYLNRHALAAEALEKLSGTLSYDNVATAKEILKRIVD